MASIVMRTGYLAVPEYVGEGNERPESLIRWLIHKRLSQAEHYKMITRRQLDCPIQYQGVLFSFEKVK